MAQRETTQQKQSFGAVARRVSLVSIAVNVALTAFKVLAGIVAHSGAMISDAIHSASDIFSTVLVMIGVSVSERRPDAHHPYGHERMECVASILLAVILAITGVGIGISGIRQIASGAAANAQIGVLALVAACVSIATKEWMYHYTKNAARRIKSDALMADAWHHRSDAISSVGALIGIAGARLGVPVMDAIASIAICVLIVFAAVGIFREAVDKMVDHACDEQTVEKICACAAACEGVRRVDEVRTRMFGARSYVDIEISADAALSLASAHEIAERVHAAVEAECYDVKHCMVHVNPYAPPQCPIDDPSA